MKEYELVQKEFCSDVIKRTDPDGTVWWIPIAPGNSDYEEYLAHLENEGI